MNSICSNKMFLIKNTNEHDRYGRPLVIICVLKWLKKACGSFRGHQEILQFLERQIFLNEIANSPEKDVMYANPETEGWDASVNLLPDWNRCYSTVYKFAEAAPTFFQADPLP